MIAADRPAYPRIITRDLGLLDGHYDSDIRHAMRFGKEIAAEKLDLICYVKVSLSVPKGIQKKKKKFVRREDEGQVPTYMYCKMCALMGVQ